MNLISSSDNALWAPLSKARIARAEQHGIKVER